MSNPRWSITIRPSESANPVDAQALNDIEVYHEGVTRGEISAVVACLLAALIKYPTEQLPTVDQIKAYNAEQELAKQHPASALFVRPDSTGDAKQLWLSQAAVTQLQDALTRSGWISAGGFPQGLVRVCDYARDPNVTLSTLTEGVEQ
jgi:hypothetical protein